MQIRQHYLNNSLRNFNYVVISDDDKNAVFFDPSDIAVTRNFLTDFLGTSKTVMLTHSHHDHIKDVPALLNMDKTEQKNLQDQEIFDISTHEQIKCLDTPGHVDDHQCYLLIESGKSIGIICGDTIFNAGVGNCKNGGDLETLYQTYRNIIIKLSDDIKIYPSHDYFLTNLKFAKTIEPDNKKIDLYLEKCEMIKEKKDDFIITTIGIERQINPFFRCFNEEFQKKFQKSSQELFYELRNKRDHW